MTWNFSTRLSCSVTCGRVRLTSVEFGFVFFAVVLLVVKELGEADEMLVKTRNTSREIAEEIHC